MKKSDRMQENVGESKGEERKEWERERKRAADTGRFLQRAVVG